MIREINGKKDFSKETKIFYYSTTGNSLALARDISAGLGGAELIPIAKVLNKHVDINAARLGVIFPVHRWGLPGIVAEFLKDLKPERQQYIFAVATCGATPGPALLELGSILRKAGAELNAGFVTIAGGNEVAELPGLVKFVNSTSHKEYRSGKERLPEMLEIIKAKKEYGPDTSSFATNKLGGLMHRLASSAADSIKTSDRDFSVDDRCTLCRTCERICPRANIKIVDNKPVWNHGCELCNACIQWCPHQAIHFRNETCRYRNPEVKAEDLILR
ncbi:MAG: EFR1 family ferrodoxin [Caulobacteraceae bacterium]